MNKSFGRFCNTDSGKILSHAQTSTLQIEREIRPLAFCSVIIISLVTVHFYRLVLN